MKKRGGAKDRKPEEGCSVTVSVRLDPQQRYIVGLAARQQRRSLSSYIEWAIEESLSKVKLADGTDFAAKQQELWDVYDADRLAKLAENYPHLLDYEQQRIWKLIEEYGPAWLSEDHLAPEHDHLPFKGLLQLPTIRKRWKDFEAVANGEAPPEILSSPSDSKRSKTSA